MPTGYWSGYFDGTGDYLTIADNASLRLGSSDFCVEFWFYPQTSSNAALMVKRANSSTFGAFVIDCTGGLTPKFYASANGSSFAISGATIGTMVVNQWNHVAVYRSGTNWYGSVNGIVSTLATGTSLTLIGTTDPWVIGGDTNASWVSGYFSNTRIVIGSAVYGASNFTPPTTPLTAITNTSLLCLQDNRFKDNSVNNFTITRNGDTRISKFSPLSLTTAYDATTYGGSGYFDGNGDQLNIANNAAFEIGNGDFCYEAWVFATRQTNTYAQGIISYGIALSTGSSTCDFQINNSGYLALAYATGASTTIVDTTLFPINQWVHAVACRTGSTISLFVNGARTATAATSATVGTGGAMVIGGEWYENATTRQLQGYVSNARVIKGSHPYDATQTTLTVPTTPLTAISGTSLLLNFTNAGIYDATTINDAETEGNAQVSTTQAKFGTTSMYFDGTGDWLIVPNRQELRFGAGDFTIEFWVYFNSLTGYRQILNTASSSGTSDYSYAMVTNGTSLLYYLSSTGTSWDLVPGSSIGTVSTGQWFHVALVRNGSTFTPYLNGVAAPTATSSAALFNFATPLPIGALTAPPMQGYLQDFRITKGYARYTGNFTPPTAAFPETGRFDVPTAAFPTR